MYYDKEKLMIDVLFDMFQIQKKLYYHSCKNRNLYYEQLDSASSLE